MYQQKKQVENFRQLENISPWIERLTDVKIMGFYFIYFKKIMALPFLRKGGTGTSCSPLRFSDDYFRKLKLKQLVNNAGLEISVNTKNKHGPRR